MSDPNGLSYDQRGREPKIAYLADGAGDDVMLTLVKGGDHPAVNRERYRAAHADGQRVGGRERSISSRSALRPSR